MDTSQYMKKCLNMLDSDNFIKLTILQNQPKGKFKEQLER